MRKKTVILLSLKILLISSCAHIEIPVGNLKVYRGSSENFGLIRKQSNDFISCMEPEVDNFYCMSKEDFKAFMLKQEGCNN